MQLRKPSDIRAINRLRVLNLIRTQQGVSRADISHELGINKPSCSEIVDNLIKEGIVTEGEKTETASGRRPTPLMIAKKRYLVAGISIGLRICSIAISDLEGNVLGFKQIPTPQCPTPKDLFVLLVNDFQHMYRGDKKKLAGCVLSLSGRVADNEITVEELFEWGWKNVPFARSLPAFLDCDCILVDETEAMVSAESLLSKEIPDSFLYLNWGEHIGATLVHGSQQDRSYLGHTRIANEGSCVCGGTGCLETVSAGWAIEKNFGGKSLRELAQEKPAGFDRAMDTAALALGMEIAQTVAITGLKKVILSGNIPTLQPSLVERVTLAMRSSLPPFLQETEIVSSSLGDKARQIGPVAVALDRFVFHQSLLAQFQTNKNRYSH
ncbi:MAG: ROK family transcriptional regulator [Sphaerochaetaceae bacterium]|nr:ROK family transcriptional regulator [Spirochaetales bacterium]MDY5499657.1 ROK family transcriptional regulator [Sphaerochaetaceae bacterium]